jgi:hypothetical protein
MKYIADSNQDEKSARLSEIEEELSNYMATVPAGTQLSYPDGYMKMAMLQDERESLLTELGL